MDFNHLYIIEIIDGDKTIREVLTEHERGLSMAIVEKICYAVDNDIKRIRIAEIKAKGTIISLHSSYNNFVDTLESNIDNLIKYEEYEICALGKKCIDKIKEKKY